MKKTQKKELTVLAPCRVCDAKERPLVEAALLAGHDAEDIGTQLGFSKEEVTVHLFESHLTPTRDQLTSALIADQKLTRDAYILGRDLGNAKLMAAGLAARLKNFELLSKMTGAVPDGPRTLENHLHLDIEPGQAKAITERALKRK